MKKYLLLSVLLCFFHPVHAQNNDGSVEITPAIIQKINKEVTGEAQLLKAKLQKEKVNDMEIEFVLDTFRVEKYAEKLPLLLTDAAMSRAEYQTAERYDSLLNKYYKKLLNVLKPGDKAVLIAAQKAWISFRDKEFTLVETISKDEYSGGGTLQHLTESGTYLEMIKARVITIFQHLQRATKNE